MFFQRSSIFVAAQVVLLLATTLVFAQNGGQLKLTGDYTVGSLKKDQNLQGSQPVTYFFDLPVRKLLVLFPIFFFFFRVHTPIFFF
jgi:hypothetical protein